MRKTLTFAVAAAAMATALPALAQSTSAPATQSSPSAQSAPSAGAPASASAAASSTLTVGQPVKDKTGAVIGSISDIKGDTATVKMGDQSFAIGSSSFVVQDGAAVINATQAELKEMIAKAGAPAG